MVSVHRSTRELPANVITAASIHIQGKVGIITGETQSMVRQLQLFATNKLRSPQHIGPAPDALAGRVAEY
jgi:hypothetical protein